MNGYRHARHIVIMNDPNKRNSLEPWYPWAPMANSWYWPVNLWQQGLPDHNWLHTKHLESLSHPNHQLPDSHYERCWTCNNISLSLSIKVESSVKASKTWWISHANPVRINNLPCWASYQPLAISYYPHDHNLDRKPVCLNLFRNSK